MGKRLLCVLLMGVMVAMWQTPASATSITTEDLSGPSEPSDLADALVGSGVSVSNVTFTGSETAGGTFESADPATVGFDDGVVLSSGAISDVIGPNDSGATTTSHGTLGDDDLSALTGQATYDASVLEFDFVPNGSEVFFEYVFSSEEYLEFVNSSFDDVFGFFVNGTNCATVNGERVSINTINPGSNPEYYRDNGDGSIDTEMDGLTVVLTCSAAVNKNQTNHMKLAIADSSDTALDSNVFIGGGTLTTDPDGCGEDGLQALGTSGVASGVVHGQVEPVLAANVAQLEEPVHGLNCDQVVPLEDTIDGLLMPLIP